jgi:Kef-type K+ transport system membrane component KefB
VPKLNVFRTLAIYVAMIVATVGLFLLIQSHGASLMAPPAPAVTPGAVASAGTGGVLLHVLLALAAVIVVGQVLGRLFAYLRQPPVIGEVVAGILLGPSLLGAELSALILPPAAAPALGLIAQLGAILYMFLVGLELNASQLKHRVQATVITSHASIVVPFLLGAVLALELYPRLSHDGVPFTSFALFMGVAMSITAFPVLARILADHGIIKTPLGVTALSCAAIDDVTAWCLLALVIGVAQAQVNGGLLVVVGALIYIAFMFLAVKPAVAKTIGRWDAEHLPRGAVALVFVALLLSALATEAIGIHAIFGAFLLGVVIPHDSVVARNFTRQLEGFVTVVLLPAFFAYTGMRTRIDLLSSAELWLICGLIIAVATLGKFGGTFVAARLTGLSWRDATALGALMNTRGLMELIVLNIGLDLGVISPTLFTLMVVMALVTTVMAAPVLHWLQPKPAAGAARKRALGRT